MTDKTKLTKKEINVEVSKYLFMLGKLCMMNFRFDPKDSDENTEDIMIKSLSMMQMMICELLEMPKEDQLEGMRKLDSELPDEGEAERIVKQMMNGLPN